MKFSAAGEPFKMKYVWQALADWKTWFACKLLNYSTRFSLYDADLRNSGDIYGLVGAYELRLFPTILMP